MKGTTKYANNLFEQPWWLDIVAPRQWKEKFVIDKSGKVIARMPYVTDGRRIIMPKLTQTLGIWMDTSLQSNYSKQKKVINEIFKDLPYHTLNIALSIENQYVLPFRWLGCNIEPWFSYRIFNLENSEAIYNRFDSRTKRDIRHAEKRVNIINKADSNTLWEMLNKTFAVQNRKNPLPQELVYKIVESCEATNHGQYYEARDDENNVHSCAYFVFDENVCYYLLGASDSKFRSSGAQSLIIWKGIQFASEHSKVFDFEGSMVEGIEHFFKQFGGECITFYHIKKQSIIYDFIDILKPKIKKLVGYKI